MHKIVVLFILTIVVIGKTSYFAHDRFSKLKSELNSLIDASAIIDLHHAANKEP